MCTNTQAAGRGNMKVQS